MGIPAARSTQGFAVPVPRARPVRRLRPLSRVLHLLCRPLRVGRHQPGRLCRPGELLADFHRRRTGLDSHAQRPLLGAADHPPADAARLPDRLPARDQDPLRSGVPGAVLPAGNRLSGGDRHRLAAHLQSLRRPVVRHRHGDRDAVSHLPVPRRHQDRDLRGDRGECLAVDGVLDADVYRRNERHLSRDPRSGPARWNLRRDRPRSMWSGRCCGMST